MTVQGLCVDLALLEGYMRETARRTGLAPTLLLALWVAYAGTAEGYRPGSAFARQGFTAWLELEMPRLRALEAQIAEELR